MADPRLVAQGEQRRQEILAFIRRHIGERGYAPTNREIGEEVGLSRNAVHAHLTMLAEHGLITITPGIARGITVTRKGRRATA